jgi:hypothetical protein
LMTSLYKRHPVGSLLVWATQSNKAAHRGDNDPASGIIKLLLDGQQRITSLYGIIRGQEPCCKVSASQNQLHDPPSCMRAGWGT